MPSESLHATVVTALFDCLPAGSYWISSLLFLRQWLRFTCPAVVPNSVQSSFLCRSLLLTYIYIYITCLNLLLVAPLLAPTILPLFHVSAAADYRHPLAPSSEEALHSLPQWRLQSLNAPPSFFSNMSPPPPTFSSSFEPISPAPYPPAMLS